MSSQLYGTAPPLSIILDSESARKWHYALGQEAMMATGPVRVNLVRGERVLSREDVQRMEDARHRWAAMQRRHEWEQQHPWRSRWLRLRSTLANVLLRLGERISR